MSGILIFDSGVGNRAIAKTVHAHVPNVELHLVSDTAFFPYGNKTDHELINRALVVLTKAIQLIRPEVLVLACNTLSTIALEQIRQSCKLSVVGVVPAIKPAAIASQTKVIGLIATPATINRDYTTELINEFASDCKVIKVGSTKLVHMAELYYQTQAIDRIELQQIMAAFIHSHETDRLDQLVLGCTHFPLIRDEIQKILPDVNIQDSSEAIARQVHRLIHDNPTVEMKTVAQTSYVTTISGDIVVTD